MDSFLVNCKPGNWDICNKYTIFGLKDTSLPPLTKGDLILLRITGSNYGLQALWYVEYVKKVVNQKNIQLTDEDYSWIINCKKILTLSNRLSEEFQTSSKKSSKITDLYAGGIQKTVVDIKQPQLRDYIFHIFKEFNDELNVNCNYLGEDVNVRELLQKILSDIVAVAPFPDSEDYKIIESVPEKKEKLNNTDTNLQEKSDKSSNKDKEKGEKQSSEKNKKSEKTEMETEEIVNEPTSQNKEKLDKPSPDLLELSDENPIEKEKKSDKQISEENAKSEKTEMEMEEVVNEPISKNKKKLNELSSDLIELSDEIPIEKEEKSDKQISEKNTKSDKTEIVLEEVVNEPTLKNEEKLADYSSDLPEESDEPPLKKEEKPDEQISERKEKPDKTEKELEEIADDSILEQDTELEESVLEPDEDYNKNKVSAKISKQQVYEKVGERVNLPILNYAPLNEKGILLLFGHYMLKLGFSHVEEIRTDFPDVIAIRSIGNGKYQRVRIGFEFKSSSFPEKGHKINECDLIVCWNHDWNDCPIEVIELSKALFEK